MSISDQEEQRIEKLEELRKLGVNPFPARCGNPVPAEQVIEAGETDENTTVCGRIIAKRDHGKTVFADLRDSTGEIQIYLGKKVLTEKDWEILHCLDLGDIIQVSGTVFTTRMGELTVRCMKLTLLAKAIRPLPVVKVDANGMAHDEVHDIELLYRHRCIDLLMSPVSKKRFICRSRIVSALRRYLDENGYIEVDTPVLQSIYGGAAADPFVTEYTSMNEKYYLRIAKELYLKRVLTGGIDRVYEIGRDFRNEGVDRTHSPEFTQLEMYEAWTDYNGMMNRFEEMTRTAAEAAGKGTTFEYNGRKLDISAPFKRIDFADALKQESGEDLFSWDDADLLKLASRLEIAPGTKDRLTLIDKLFDHYVVRNIEQPTFVVDYPEELSPLTKIKPEGEGITERFEAFIMGLELANAFSEQNDPFFQRRVFEEQAASSAHRDGEVDEDFLFALESGMPPAGGMGIGIDRLVMIMTDAGSIRDTILFPHLRKQTDK